MKTSSFLYLQILNVGNVDTKSKAARSWTHTSSVYMKHFGSHPNEECRNELSTYSTDVMFVQKFLTWGALSLIWMDETLLMIFCEECRNTFSFFGTLENQLGWCHEEFMISGVLLKKNYYVNKLKRIWRILSLNLFA